MFLFTQARDEKRKWGVIWKTAKLIVVASAFAENPNPDKAHLDLPTNNNNIRWRRHYTTKPC